VCVCVCVCVPYCPLALTSSSMRLYKRVVCVCECVCVCERVCVCVPLCPSVSLSLCVWSISLYLITLDLCSFSYQLCALISSQSGVCSDNQPVDVCVYP